MKETYERHGLGVGVFTMEGFEYKNYSSKQAVKNQTNKKKQYNSPKPPSVTVTVRLWLSWCRTWEKNRKRRDEKRKENRREIPIFDDVANSMTIDGQSDDVLGTVEPPVRV